MRQRTGALVALGIASALVLGIVGSADASLTSAPHGSNAVPGPRPRPLLPPRPTVIAEQPARPTVSPAAGAAPHRRETAEAWARSSLYVAGI